jgi:hypothetical protein
MHRAFIWIASSLCRLLLATGIRADEVSLRFVALGASAGIAAAFGQLALRGINGIGRRMRGVHDERRPPRRSIIPFAGSAARAS